MKVERKGPVVSISLDGRRLDGPDRAEEVRELVGACERIDGDDEVRVVVVSWQEGAPVEFPEEVTGSLGLACEERVFSAFNSAADAIGALDRPVIGCIGEDCIGAALEVLMACDIRVAGESVRLGLPQITGGMIPHHGGTQRLPRLVGPAKALEMVLTGCLIGADEAYRVGLVNRIVPPGTEYARAMEIAEELAKKAPIAVRYTKEALQKGMELTLDQGLRMEGDLYLLLYSTADRTEGITAFKEKRESRFKGE
jgi:enoyl-CoA hydratase/carnithine racemase